MIQALKGCRVTLKCTRIGDTRIWSLKLSGTHTNLSQYTEIRAQTAQSQAEARVETGAWLS
jgi:hypothetical protein